MPLSPHLLEALSYAATLHADQQRKASGEPYLSHLLAVAALVMEYGGNEEETIAALLHDAVEDQGGMATLAEIGRRFGPAVAEIVEGCSDTAITPKPPWRQRKEAYIARLPSAEEICSTRLHTGQSRVARRNAAVSSIGASRLTRNAVDSCASVHSSTGPTRVSAAALLISVALSQRVPARWTSQA